MLRFQRKNYFVQYNQANAHSCQNKNIRGSYHLTNNTFLVKYLHLLLIYRRRSELNASRTLSSERIYNATLFVPCKLLGLAEEHVASNNLKYKLVWILFKPT